MWIQRELYITIKQQNKNTSSRVKKIDTRYVYRYIQPLDGVINSLGGGFLNQIWRDVIIYGRLDGLWEGYK